MQPLIFHKKKLLAVLACPPTTSGTRTLARVHELKSQLGLSDVAIVNLLKIATYRTTDISRVGVDKDVWIASRGEILRSLEESDFVLFAYGLSEPTGLARKWHREQIAWLQREISDRELIAFQIGDGPRHPSRWHRLTTRTHPGQDVSTAVVELIQVCKAANHASKNILFTCR
jgi:hypothetical protein